MKLTEGQKRKYKEEFMREFFDKKRFGGMRKIVLERDSYACVQCGMSQQQHIILFDRSLTIDHIDGNGRHSAKPNNSLDNLQTLCLPCHGKKDHRPKREEAL